MMGFLQWIESAPLSVWLKESPSIWAYPTMLFLHTVGLSCAVGPSVVLDLRLLGFARRVPISPCDAFFKVIWIGFWINALSGAVLLASDATAKLTNPVFYLKMAFVFLALAVMVVMRRRVFRAADLDATPVARVGKCLAVASMVCWFGAITAGRFMAYFSRG